MISIAAYVILGLIFVLAFLFAYSEGTWMKVITFCSMSIKGALFILLWGNMTDNLQVVVVALSILILGDLSVMVLAIALERRSS